MLFILPYALPLRRRIAARRGRDFQGVEAEFKNYFSIVLSHANASP
jgi:hypothetical protein